MSGISDEIRDTIDNYRVANETHRLLIGADAIRQLFYAERVWKGICKVDAAEERSSGGME